MGSSGWGDGRFLDASLRPFIRFAESLHQQNVAMRRILERQYGDQWRQVLADELSRVNASESAEQFKPVYESLVDRERFHQAIQVFLGIKNVI